MSDADLLVLVIGEHEGCASDYEQLLRQNGASSCQVIEAIYGENTLDTLQPDRLSIILLDGSLSYLDAPTVLNQVQLALGKTGPPVLMVGTEDIRTAVKAVQAGAADYLVREHLTPETLRMALHTAMENAQLKRELHDRTEQFEVSVENMLDCFGIFTSMRDAWGQIVDFRIDYLNAAACANNHMTLEQQFGRGLCEVLPGHRESGLFDEYCQLVETGIPLVKESLVYDDRYDGQHLVQAFDIRANKLNDGFVASWRNVTEYKRLETELKASQQHYQTLAEAMPQMVWEGDTDGNIRYWNRRWYEYTGFSETTSMGLAGVEAVHPEDRDRTLTQWDRAIKGGKTFEIEHRIRHHDGSYRWFLNRGIPIQDDQENLTGWIGTITNIDDQKQLEERFQLVLRAVDSLVYDWNLETNTICRSEKLRDLLGFHPQEVPPQADWWNDRIHPEDRQRLKPHLASVLEGSHELFEADYRIRHRDGHWVHVWDQSCVVRNPQGKVVRIVGSTMDISDRKRAELAIREAHVQLESALAAGSVYTWRWNIQANLVGVNRSFAHLFGIEADGASIELPIERFLAAVHEDDRANLAAAIDQAIARRESYAAEFRVHDVAGEEHWVIARGRVEYDANDMPVAFPGALADITQRKRTEATLRQQNARLEFILETSKLGIWEVDLGEQPYRARMRSPRHDQIYGYDTQLPEWTYDTFISHIHPGDQALVETTFQQALDALDNWDLECRIVRADGDCRWVWISGSFYHDDEGHSPRLMGIIADITDRKQIEMARQHSEAVLEAFIAASPVALALFDRDLRYLYANEALATINDLPLSEHLGKTLWEVVPAIASEFASLLQTVMQTREPVQNLEFSGEVRPGIFRSTLANHYPVCLPSGEVIGVGIAILDVTELTQAQREVRENEERFRTLADNIAQFAWITDAPGNIVWYNKRWFDYTGTTPEEVLGWGWQKVHHPDHLERVINRMNHCFATGEIWEDTFPLRGRDGEYRWFLSRAVPLRNEQGQIERWFGTNTDITELRQTQLALQTTTERLNVALKSAPITLFNHDRDLRYTWIYNPLSYQAEQVIGKRDDELMSAESALFLMELKQRVLDSGVGLRQEIKVAIRDTIRCFDLTIDPILGDRDEVVGITCAAVDISERAQLEAERQQVQAALAANEARLRGFVESNVVGILYGDIYGGIAEANDAFLRMVGYTREDLREDRLRWTNLTPPEYLPLDRQAIAEARERGACTPYEKEYIRKDGSRVPVLLGYSLVGEAREETVAFILDLSDRKEAELALRQSEDRLRMAVKSGQLGTWDWNLATNELSWDATCRAIFGWPPEAEVSAEVFINALHADDRDRIKQVMKESLDANGDGSCDVEYRIISIQDNIERWVRATGQVYCNSEGHPLRFIGVVLDISQQKQIEAQRVHLLQQEQAAREAAERANRIKDEFLAILSHELRSPLNPILGWAKMLQTRKMSPEVTTRALSTIERNARLQTQLIDDLLDVARILRGKLKLNMTAVDPVFVVEAAIETVQATAAAKAITIRADLSEIGQIWADASRLQQIVWNLLSNAVKFTSERGDIQIRLFEADNQAQIQVVDTGRGIHPDFLPHIFESFRQEDTSITRQFGGLGLGLAIVRYLVEAHGGGITADSPGEGQGATFTVRLPLLSLTPVPTTLNQKSPLEVDLAGIQIWVVDDSPDTLEVLTISLEQFGAAVVPFSTGADLLAHLQRSRPDILVCDIGMPDMDGYSLIEQIRTTAPRPTRQIPAIALTAYARDEERQRALNQGFQQHMAKPFDPDQLAISVAQLCPQASQPLS